MDDVSDTVSADDSESFTPDTSVGSGTSTATLSDLVIADCQSKRQILATQKWFKLEKRNKKRNKKRKEKISKNDFHTKMSEFKVWLNEVKKVKFESLALRQQKEYFKRFVKKWNARKLDMKYYQGVLWAVGTPDTQTNWAMPCDVDVTPGSVGEDSIEEKYSRAGTSQATSLGTFGKNTGAKMLRELRSLENTVKSISEEITSEENVNVKVNKLLPLQQLFIPPEQKATENVFMRMKQSDEESWPTPPSSYSTAFETVHPKLDGKPQKKLIYKTVDDSDDSLPPYPDSSQLSLRHSSCRLVKADIPIIKPLQPVMRKATETQSRCPSKPRPMSCMDGVMPRCVPAPPQRSSSSENIQMRYSVHNVSGEAGNDARRGDPSVSQCRYRSVSGTSIPPQPPQRTVSLEKVNECFKLPNPKARRPLPYKQMKALSREENVRRRREGRVTEMNCNKKRCLLDEEVLGQDNTATQNVGMQSQGIQSYPSEPEAKSCRLDSYASSLSSANCVVPQKTKSIAKTGHICPAEVIPSSPHGPILGKDIINTADEVLTPGKSSVSTLL